MSKTKSKNIWPIFVICFLPALVRCGVKLPPKSDTIEEGPLARFEKEPAPKDPAKVDEDKAEKKK